MWRRADDTGEHGEKESSNGERTFVDKIWHRLQVFNRHVVVIVVVLIIFVIIVVVAENHIAVVVVVV